MNSMSPSRMLTLLPQPAFTVRHVPAELGLVEHVVVDERRGVDHLDHRGERVVGRRHLPARLRGEQQQRRAEPLAAVVPEVLDERAERDCGSGARVRSKMRSASSMSAATGANASPRGLVSARRARPDGTVSMLAPTAGMTNSE